MDSSPCTPGSVGDDMRTWWIALIISGLLVGCGAPTADDDDDDATTSPTPDQYALEDGTYDYLVSDVPADTCWAPPKTLPEAPSTISAQVESSGNTVTVTPEIQQGITQSFVMERDGDNLSGVASGDVDLNQTDLAVDCILHIEGTFDGVMTADNTFDAVQTVDVSEAGGTVCFLLVGDLDPNQVDQLPCSFTLSGTGTLVTPAN